MGLLEPLVLGPSVLEPDLDLGLGEPQRAGELEAPAARHVLAPGASVLELKLPGLLLTEGRALPARLAFLFLTSRH